MTVDIRVVRQMQNISSFFPKQNMLKSTVFFLTAVVEVHNDRELTSQPIQHNINLHSFLNRSLKIFRFYVNNNLLC